MSAVIVSVNPHADMTDLAAELAEAGMDVERVLRRVRIITGWWGGSLDALRAMSGVEAVDFDRPVSIA